MAKAKKQEVLHGTKGFRITSAKIKDDFCDYSFERTEGVGKGDVHKVSGKGIIDDDLKVAFTILNAHLSVVDDVFKHSDIEIDNIDKMHNHELVGNYHVSGIKIKGEVDNESISIVGTKHVSCGGRISIETPSINMDSLSSYPWYNELKSASDKIRMEVELYIGGKYTEVDEEEKVNPKQMTIADSEDFDISQGKV